MLLVMPWVAINIQAVLFLTIILLSMKRSEPYGIMHPLSCFSIFYFLYSVSYPLYFIINNESNREIELVIPICLSGYLAFALGVLTISRKKSTIPKIRLNSAILESFTWCALLVCMLLIVYIIESGVSSKREFLDFVRAKNIDVAFSLFSIASVIYVLRLLLRLRVRQSFNFRRDILDRLGCAILIVFMVGFGVTGERDIVFRLLFLVFLVLFSTVYKYKFYYLLLAAAALVLIMPFSQSAKAYLISGSVAYEGYMRGDIYKTDFASAGRILYYVISNDITGYNGESILWDFKRYLSVFFPNQHSTGVWFNDNIRYIFGDHGTSGWGFSLVAEGYMNFGVFGPSILFFAIGLVSGFLYRLSMRHGFYYLFYLLYVPTIIYVIRADLANYLSLAFKVNVVIVLVIYGAAYIIGRGGLKRENLGVRP